MVEASITGFFRTVLIIIGVLALLRFLGQIMIAKRNLAAEQKMKEEQEKNEKEVLQAKKNFGKTHILSNNAPRNRKDSVEDVDFVEVNR